jgi:hypothetical protein
MWNDAEETLCEPYPPYRTIDAIHLAGPGKTRSYNVRRTGGGSFEAMLLQGVKPLGQRLALRVPCQTPAL